MSESSSYQRHGEVESHLEVEPQPPIFISAAAQEKLESWGLGEAEIAHLRSLCQSFRYDLCAEKIMRQAATDAFVFDGGNGLVVELPHFFDLKGRFDGQCADIALQFLIQAEFSGWLNDINETLQLPDGMKLVTAYCMGRSKTHFNHNDTSHVWNAIGIVDRDGNLLDSLLIDAAFQTIQTQDESGYQTDTAVYNPTEISLLNLEARARIGRLQFDDKDLSCDLEDSIVLGVSGNRKYAFSIGFAVRHPYPIFVHADVYTARPEEIMPYLNRIDANGQSEIFFINPDTNQVTTTLTYNDLTPDELDEIYDILIQCQAFKFNFNRDEYPRSQNEKLNVKFKSD